MMSIMASGSLVEEGGMSKARIEGSSVSELEPPRFSLVSSRNQSLLTINALTLLASFIIQLYLLTHPL